MDPSTTRTVPTIYTEAEFLVQLVRCVMGQHVTLDVQLPPPWMRRLPGSEPPLMELVQFHLERFQQQWPMEIPGHRLGNFSFRIMFTHVLPRQCTVFASVNRAWYSLFATKFVTWDMLITELPDHFLVNLKLWIQLPFMTQSQSSMVKPTLTGFPCCFARLCLRLSDNN